jgi:stage VI sporulation protein D
VKGGSDLTQENQSYLRFSLEESVWFQKGQEVEELYSISLDPNVTCTEDDHYVYIRGTLDLSGEYANEENEEAEDFTNVFLPKSVQSVERNSDGLYEFMHRFPVDITIPSSRIAALDDIEVSIQTFDYTIPERNSLKLQADLIISGVYSENYEEPSEVEEDGLVIVDEREKEAEDEAVEIEISDVLNQLEELVGKTEDKSEESEREAVDHWGEAKEPNKEDKEVIAQSTLFENDKTPPVKNAAAPPTIPDFQPALRDSKENEGELYEPFTVEAKRKPEVEEERKETEPIYVSKKKEIPQFEIPVSPIQVEENVQPIVRKEEPVPAAKEENKQKIEAIAADARVEEKEQEIEPIAADTKAEREEINILHVLQTPRRPAPRVENREQKQEAKEEEQTEAREKTSESLSIADFFSRKQEEEHVRVKVCIVQKGETLDDLAERYAISVQTILQSNELQPNQDIHEGQVLYIRQPQVYKNS